SSWKRAPCLPREAACAPRPAASIPRPWPNRPCCPMRTTTSAARSPSCVRKSTVCARKGCPPSASMPKCSAPAACPPEPGLCLEGCPDGGAGAVTMQLTQFTDLGLRVLMYLSHPDRGTPVTVGEIATRFGASRNHLIKVVHFMAQQGWLITTRGKGGGLA